MARNDDKVRCSFCGKTGDQVRKMISGPSGTYICDECIELCAELIEDELDQEELEPGHFVRGSHRELDGYRKALGQ